MSLTRTAYLARKLIKYGGGGLVIFLILWSVGVAAVKAYMAAHPPYTPPTVKYGRLPRIVFPEKTFEKKGFTAEMADDKLPSFKDQAKVYVVYRPVSSFMALEYDTRAAKEMGFTSKPTESSPGSGIYIFKNDNLNQTLTMNVPEGSFKLSYPYQNDQMLLVPDKVPGKEEAIESARSFLKNAGRLPEDLDNGEKKVSYWKIEYDGLKQVSAPSEANVARVDFFRMAFKDEFKIVQADPNRAVVSILVSGSTVEGKKIVEVNYKYVSVDRESFSTYPIKTAQEAWDELKTGNYWPSFDVRNKDLIIRKMYLAYFEPVTLTNYMQPVFVFEGDGNFMAYVPAVKDNYVK